MNTVKYILLLVAAMFSYASDAQILPDPIFCEEPATVELILKNDPAGDYENLHIVHQCLMYQSSESVFFQQIKADKKERVYTAELNIGVTSSCDLCLHNRMMPNAIKMNVILVPGQKLTCTYDCKKGTLSCSGSMGRLSEEIANYSSDGKKYSKQTVLGVSYYGREELANFGGITPDKFLEVIMQRYRDAKKTIEADRKVSKEFLAVWNCDMAIYIPNLHKVYYAYYRGEHPDYNVNFDDSTERSDKELNPLADNGIFYTNTDLIQDYRFNELLDIYRKNGLSKIIEQLVKAKNIMERIDDKGYLLDPEIAYVKENIPEYLPFINRYMDSRKKVIEKMHAGPEKGTVCSLDRSLEGDAILPGLLSRYNNGKPTLITFAPNSYLFNYGSFSNYLKHHKDCFNIVYLTGGDHSDEAMWKQTIHENYGDFYYLMKYQFNCLNKDDYYKNFDYPDMVFDADGKQILEGKQIEVDDLKRFITRDNFKLEGTVMEGLKDTGYNIIISTDGDLEVFDYTEYVSVDSTRHFTFTQSTDEPRKLHINATFPDGSTCQYGISFLMMPDETAQLRVCNGCFYLDGSKFYHEWGQADKFCEDAKRNHTDAEYHDMVLNYLKQHNDEEGCVMYYIREAILPYEDILTIASQSVKEGRLKSFFDQGPWGMFLQKEN